ncbi:MAG TPA: SDR family NAD(P)-dependent oxidoreductase [Burkholderiaceae bacterium]|nr:SDR family NAD(P)-dependent oxidoreductase [Burkholderiaceae bacterium]
MNGITLVTGAAGFIGYHVSKRLLERGEHVVGLDNVNDYYDPTLKEARLAQLANQRGFTFERLDLGDSAGMAALFKKHKIGRIVHLAAQAGVRYSITNPHAYIDSNMTGFLNILEAARHNPVTHCVYASSSSVYGGNKTFPFSTADRVDRPVSLYAATKRANELMAYVYSRQFHVPLTGLRFFTVYGPWGRPDMAAFLFTRAILADEPIEVYNHGDMRRDFTYIDDIVEGILRVLEGPPPTDEDGVRHRVYNIGNHHPEPLMRFIETLGRALGKMPQMKMLPLQMGDVPATYADIEDLRRDFGWQPTVTIDEGLPNFVAWYRKHYNV